ncbi:MAG: GNAT family N-acetyltransferase [Chloroflexi bacterium]|nr:GNAT family N-acetyltransferase [Chloroflexota bacterium]
MSQPTNRVVRIRPALPRDAAAMTGAHARSWRATYAGLLPDSMIDDVVAARGARTARWRALLADPERRGGSFVAVIDRRVVGFVFWGPDEESEVGPATALVHAIYLDPDVIGSGIGRSLFEAAVDDMVAHGFAAAVLWVLDSNERARRFYEAAGWLPDGAVKTERRPGGDRHEVRYARKLGRD